ARRRRLRRRRVEQAEITRAGAAADFVIAAHHDPGRGEQRRRGGGEEIRLPGRPVVAVGAARATAVARRTGALAGEIVADMDDDGGLGGGDARGPRCEWASPPGVSILGLCPPLPLAVPPCGPL